MRHGFLNLVSPDGFRHLLSSFPALPDREEIPLARACGRVLAADLISPEDLPRRDRSAMDGYAVAARDVFSASESNPAYLECDGHLPVDADPAEPLQPGRTFGIVTGGLLPPGADAVVMVEHTEEVGGGTIAVTRPAAPGGNLIPARRDAKAGEPALPGGTRLRPQEIGLLAALGLETAGVRRRPRAALLSTGDEVVDHTAEPRTGQVRDVNGPALGCMVRRAGGEVLELGRVGDDLEAIASLLSKGAAGADLVLASGGSSAGGRDMTREAVEAAGGRILAHGVTVSPGKPTLLAELGGRPVLGLPGQVTSAQVVMWLFGLPLLAHLEGESEAFDISRRPRLRAELARNLASKQGREDWVRARIEYRDDAPPLARPLLAPSGLLSTMLGAHGLVRIPSGREGYESGAAVDVFLLE
ncbi:gephyrin-like molybdotransferase Glp [Desulfohalovibrio reitneri]|uniref:molybdopterin molybdotransferase MoeA n=1 Tax=Desulfohalovibrio reitneri TaxID=1307759 RepID=UPI0004A6F749|nr:gephyrin-like molybdotransferase Glp [Desulfohalovibrio reitneri]